MTIYRLTGSRELNVKALVGAFNQEKASEGASPMDCLQVCSSIHNPTRLHGCTVNLRIAAPSREISMRFIVTDGQLVVTSSQPDKGGGRIFSFGITAFTCGKIYICKE